MNAPVIRTACKNDIEAIADLQARSIMAFGPSAYELTTCEAWAQMGREVRHKLLESGIFFVAELGDDLVGVAGWTADSREPDCAWPRYVFVAPKAAGRGIGRHLLAKVEHSANAAGRPRLQVWSSLNAVGFYKKLGFRDIKSARWPVKGVIDMEFRLMAKAMAGTLKLSASPDLNG